MLKRVSDWDKRLAEFIQSRRNMPHTPGQQDCAMFACDAVLAITGTDIASEIRGKYTTEAEAQALIQSLTGGLGIPSYIEHLTETYEIPECPIKRARRGDIVTVTLPKSSTFGVVGTDGSTAYFAVEHGLEAIPVLQCERAWRIG